VFAVLIGTAVVTGSSAGEGPPPPCDTDRAIAGILDPLHDHRLVLLGEQHRRKEFHDFLRALVRDPRFGAVVDDVVVEFGNARYQDLVDRWIAGGAGDADISSAWRETTQILVWDSPLYEDFYRSIRDLNRGLPAQRRKRVLLGDPPIDWSKVADATDYGRFAERDETFAGVVEREVLARGRTALLVVGGEHVLRTPRAEPLPVHPGVGDLLTRRHPGATFAVYAVPSSRPLADHAGCSPRLIPTSGEVGKRSFAELLQPGLKVQRTVDGKRVWVAIEQAKLPPIRERADALLWLGPTETLVPEPRRVLEDAAYVTEVHRRAKIMSEFFGLDLTTDLPPIPQRESRESRASRPRAAR